MENIDLDKVAAEFIEDIKSMKDLSADVKGIKEAVAAESNFFKKIWAGGKALHKLIVHVINHVEEIAKDLKLASDQKRDLAVAIINKLVDLPILGEGAEAKIIGFAVDSIVTGFNENFGKEWFSKIPRIA